MRAGSESIAKSLAQLAAMQRVTRAEERARTQAEIVAWLRQLRPNLEFPKTLAARIEAGEYRKDDER